MEVIRKGTEFGARLRVAVVMDDHVHVLFAPGDRLTSSRFVQAWKSASSHVMVKASQRTAPLWQAEYYLRWMSSQHAIDVCARYIRNNPDRRWRGVVKYPWMLP